VRKHYNFQYLTLNIVVCNVPRVLHNFCASPNVIRLIKWRRVRVRWMEHISCISKMRWVHLAQD